VVQLQQSQRDCSSHPARAGDTDLHFNLLIESSVVSNYAR
jgi:hypothetical protein